MNEKIIKTVHQYSKPLPENDMAVLIEIAQDYQKVKNYVYKRYSGINSRDKLSPGYTILNEMRECGLRSQLNFPSTYYELAVLDAVKDVRSMWSNLKQKIQKLVSKNENLLDNEKKYIRTILKMDSVYTLILTGKPYEMPHSVEGLELDCKKLNSLICRLTRRYKPEITSSNDALTFRMTKWAYRYDDGKIMITTKIQRRRIAVPLTDDRQYDRQITVKIRDNTVELDIPVEAKIKKHEDYENIVFISLGYRTMFTLSNGNTYGEELGVIVSGETDRLTLKNQQRYKMYKVYSDSVYDGDTQKAAKILKNNMGKKQYNEDKLRVFRKTCNYINSEINRMIKTEKPCEIVIPAQFSADMNGLSRQTRNKFTRSFDGYIREKLRFKCLTNDLKLTEISPYNIGVACSKCGEKGKKQNVFFICPACGNKILSGLNSAVNIENKFNNG